jgi:N-acetylglucosaminyl-diphospho-decaprenol L-rhamnosyltransferase
MSISPDATAIVVTHNSARQVGACLAALRRAGIALRVVDNASRDGTLALVARDFPDATVIANPDNVGFARAVNQALHGVDSAVVLLVNPDCVVPPATTAALVGLLCERSDIGVAGPRLLDAAGRTAVSAHPFESLASVLASRFGGGLVPVQVRQALCGRRRRRTYVACLRSDRATDVDWLSGACLAVRTGLLRAVGGLDEGYFLYYEDEELCLRAWARGARVVYLPAVTAVHTGGGSSADPAWIWPHLYASMLRFFARHRRTSYPAVRAAVLVRALVGIGLATARTAVHPEAGAARMRAWRAIARVAVTHDPDAAGRSLACTY